MVIEERIQETANEDMRVERKKGERAKKPQKGGFSIIKFRADLVGIKRLREPNQNCHRPGKYRRVVSPGGVL